MGHPGTGHWARRRRRGPPARRDRAARLLAPLPRPHDGRRDRRCPRAVSAEVGNDLDRLLEQRRIEQFLFHEARLIDERRFAEWERLWDDEGIYWVPANGEGTDPDRDVSLIYDN